MIISTNPLNVKKLSILITISIFIIIMLYRVDNVNYKYDTTKNEKMASIFKQTNFIYTDNLNNLNTSLISRLNNIASNEQVIKAIIQKDRQKLYDISAKRFIRMKETFPELKGMQYHTSDYISFLRLNKPNLHGDNISTTRPIIKHAIDTKSIQKGFARSIYDKTQSLIYKIVVPINSNGEFLGVVEIAIDTTKILDTIDNFFKSTRNEDVYLGFVLYKENSDTIVISNNNLVPNIIKNIDLNKKDQIFIHNDKDYFVFWNKENLKAYNSKKVGTIFYAFDITDLENRYKQNIILSVAQPLAGMIILSIILIFLFNLIKKQNIGHQKKIMSIVDNQNAIIISSTSTTIINANKSFLKFFAIKHLDEFLIKYDCICDTFEDKSGYLTKYNTGNKINWIDFIQSTHTVNHKVMILDKRGRAHIFQVNLNKSTGSIIDEYIVTFEDITQLENINKNQEELIFNKTKELHLANTNLEKRISQEVTKSQKKDQQLYQQSRLAQMGEMMSMIAHQWRQPLAAISSTAISLNIKAQLGKINNDIIIDKSEKISEYSQHLSSTIDDFREFFKPNKELQDIVLTDIIHNVLHIIEASISNENISIIKDFKCNNTISTYPNELKQVILNLIKNAEDILIETKQKEPYIKISTYKEDNNFILEVSDNGGGIPKDVLEKIFDPYFSTKTKKDGTGLGLYMSKIIIEEHCNGKLVASNDKDIGAIFKIILNINLNLKGDNT